MSSRQRGDMNALAPFLRRHVVELHGKMWGATGLNYKRLARICSC
jgi:hypothetical protein